MNEKIQSAVSKKFRSSFFSSLKTKEKANQASDFIRLVLQGMFSTDGFDIKKMAEKNYGDNVPSWFEVLEVELLEKGNSNVVRNFLLDLQEEISKVLLVKVELSFTPSDCFIENLYQIVGEIKSCGVDKNNFLLDFDVDNSITGGMKLYVGGKYVDVTLKSFLVGYLEKNDAISRYL